MAKLISRLGDNLKVNKKDFHGCNNNRAEKLLDLQKGIPSIGDRHWLGDGFYLYDEKFYAYNWINGMFKKNKQRSIIDDNDNIEEHFKILECTYNIESDRIFDLDKAEHRILLDHRREGYIKKLKKENKNLDEEKLHEGVLLNDLFNKDSIKEQFDVIVATFQRRYYKYKEMKYEFRLNTLPEKQICIRNQSIINCIEEYDYVDAKDELEDFIKQMEKRLVG